MISEYANISPKYQVTIPKNIRKFFVGIKPANKIKFEYDEKNQAIIMRPARKLEDFIGILGKPPKNADKSWKEIENLMYNYDSKKDEWI